MVQNANKFWKSAIATAPRFGVASIAACLLPMSAAEACPQVSREVAQRIEASHRQDRRRADVVVTGTWINAEDHESCGSFENPCVGRIVASKVIRGEKLVEYKMFYIHEFNLCDARDLAPPTGAFAKFYIDGTPEGGYHLVDKVFMDRN
jgi:hypothetical protein